MAIIAKDSGGGSFTPAPAGSHVAVCDMVVDLGLQENDYQGERSIKHQVYIRWELVDEYLPTDATKRFSVGKFYGLSLHEKATLRRHLESWRGVPFTPDQLKAFDIAKLLGAPCLIAVTHGTKANGDINAKVDGVMKMPKNMPPPGDTTMTPLIYDDEHPAAYDSLPEWLQKKVDAQIKPANGAAELNDDPDDFVPF